jgi:hypothetical protein
MTIYYIQEADLAEMEGLLALPTFTDFKVWS